MKRNMEKQDSKSRLLVVGASGHGKVIKALAEETGEYVEVDFLDDDDGLVQNGEVKGKIPYAVEHRAEYDVIVAIGNPTVRRRIQEYYEKEGVNVVTLIHPFSQVARDVIIGRGTVVMAGAVVQPGTRIGKGSIINTSSSVDHENVIGDYCHISVGSHLAGNVCVGDGSWIGAGATVSNNVSVCEDVMIGAGAVVVKDITESGTYVGVPAGKKQV